MNFFTLSSLLYLSITIFLLQFLYRFVVKLYFRVRFYRKQGQNMGFTPIIGDVYTYFKSVERYGDSLYTMKEIPNKRPKTSIAGNCLFDKLVIWVVDTKCIKDILSNQDKYFKTPFLIEIQKMLLGEGLLFSEDEKWKKHRKYSSIAFNYDSLKNMLPEIYNITHEFLDKLATGSLEKINIIEEVQKITAEIVGRNFFGKKFSEYTFDGEPLSVYLENLTAEAAEIAIHPLTVILGANFVKMGILKRHRKLLKNIKRFRDFAKNMVRDIIKNLEAEEKVGMKKEKVSMIEIFYVQIKNNPEDPLSEEELVSLFISFFVAGMDTTGHLIGMATYFLLKNPELKSRLMSEIDKVFSEENRSSDQSRISIDKLNSMDYFTAFLKETLRMVPPTPYIFPREATKDIKIGEIKILKGDIVNPCFIAINFNPEYHEEPNKFNPDRWITDSLTKRSVNADPFVFTPFSAGNRNCIGQHLALYEAKIILGLFLRKFEYELADKKYVMRYNFKFLYEPYEPIIYKLRKI